MEKNALIVNGIAMPMQKNNLTLELMAKVVKADSKDACMWFKNLIRDNMCNATNHITNESCQKPMMKVIRKAFIEKYCKDYYKKEKRVHTPFIERFENEIEKLFGEENSEKIA